MLTSERGRESTPKRRVGIAVSDEIETIRAGAEDSFPWLKHSLQMREVDGKETKVRRYVVGGDRHRVASSRRAHRLTESLPSFGRGAPNWPVWVGNSVPSATPNNGRNGEGRPPKQPHPSAQ